jgi:cytoskeleton protein RodZ
LNEIGELLRTTRESSGVSLEEASADLDIRTLILENIEDGNIGCFKDIFALKEDIRNYAKYLGLDSDKIIDDFNDYLFEVTSKIPVESIEKAMKEQQKDEQIQEDKIVSPYTASKEKTNSKLFILLYVAIALLIVLVVAWSVKQITMDNKTTNTISYSVKTE